MTRRTTQRLIAAVAAIVLALATIVVIVRDAPRPPLIHVPESHVTFSAHRPRSADAVLRSAVAMRVVPGATVAIGRGDQLFDLASYGRMGWTLRDSLASADSTRYDLASMTKALATTMAVFLLVQDGKIHLDDPVQRSLPAFRGRWKERVTWRHLLTHTSGLPPSARVRGRTPAARLNNILATPLTTPPADHVEYSDVGFIVLWMAAQRVMGQPLPRVLAKRIWRPLGMTSTGFIPGESCVRCAPTATLLSGAYYRGKPSDPIAEAIGVPTGNAGLFSTAHDVARFAAMIANGGVHDGKQMLSPELVRALAEQVPHAGHRTLGWEAFCPAEHLNQQQPCQHPVAFGHTGWAGTSFWIGAETHSWVVVLSNRTYEVRNPPSLDSLRAEVFERIDSAATPRMDSMPVRTAPR